MRPIKCVVLDLDGTLLNTAQTISSRNLRAIETCHAQGISVVIATARPPRAVRHLLVSDALHGFVIYFDGALTVDESHGTIYDHIDIPASVSAGITDMVLAQQPQSIISYEVQDAWYCADPIPSSRYAELGMRSDDPVPRAVGCPFIQTLSPTKLLISGFPEWQRIAVAFDAQVDVRATPDGSLVQVMPRMVSKDRALQRVLERMNIEPGDTMVFGDGINDWGLFELCGFSVAMANAIDALKRRAHYITASHENDGVAIALEDLGIIKTTPCG